MIRTFSAYCSVMAASVRTGTCISSADPEIVTAVRDLVPAGVSLRRSGEYDYALTTGRYWAGQQQADRNPVTSVMRQYGLADRRSSTKFVPDDYKFASVKQRLAVLQGLMDTDGTVFRNGMAVSFSTTSPQLAADVRFLAQSLGGTAHTRTKQPHYTYMGERRNGRIAYEVLLRLPRDTNPFRLPRKANRARCFTRYPPVRYITSVEPVGEKPASCILIDAPSHLYVTDDFIVTHNTAVMVGAGMELRRLGLARKNLYVVPKATHAQFVEQFRQVYPYAQILAPGENDFTAEKRPEFVSRMVTGDWDAVVLTQEQYQRIPVRPETEARFIRQEIENFRGGAD